MTSLIVGSTADGQAHIGTLVNSLRVLQADMHLLQERLADALATAQDIATQSVETEADITGAAIKISDAGSTTAEATSNLGDSPSNITDVDGTVRFAVPPSTDKDCTPPLAAPIDAPSNGVILDAEPTISCVSDAATDLRDLQEIDADCSPSRDTVSDCLTLIQGVDQEAARLLGCMHATDFAAIAAFTSQDVAEINRLLGTPARVSKEGWIEQAALLAEGRQTVFAKRMMQAGGSTCMVPAAEAPPKINGYLTADADVAEKMIGSRLPSVETEIVASTDTCDLLELPAVQLVEDSSNETTPTMDDQAHRLPSDNVVSLPIMRRRKQLPIAACIASLLLISTVEVTTYAPDPPPLKWSTLEYGLSP